MTVDPPESKSTYAFGSFTFKEPSLKDHCFHYKNPKKILIRDPGNNLVFEHPFFYLSIESLTGLKAQVSLKKVVD